MIKMFNLGEIFFAVTKAKSTCVTCSDPIPKGSRVVVVMKYTLLQGTRVGRKRYLCRKCGIHHIMNLRANLNTVDTAVYGMGGA
jgi:hypothetical protein